MVSYLPETLYEHAHKPRIMKHWEKLDLQEEIFDEVDWDANKQALKSTPIWRCHCLSKKELGMCGVGKMMKTSGHQDSDACPKCREPETTPYVFACKDEGAVHIFHDSSAMMEE